MKKSVLFFIISFLMICCNEKNKNIEDIDFYSKQTVSKIKNDDFEVLKISEKTCGGNTTCFLNRNNLVSFYNENGGESFKTLDIFLSEIIKLSR